MTSESSSSSLLVAANLACKVVLPLGPALGIAGRPNRGGQRQGELPKKEVERTFFAAALCFAFYLHHEQQE